MGNAIYTTEWYVRVKKGLVPKHSIIHKFGAGALGTTLAPVTISGFYRTPIAATALEIVSDNAGDGVGGVGLREVQVEGLDANWNEVSVTVVMNGTTAVAIGTEFIRVYRAFGTLSGTYSNATGASSQAGIITIQESGGGDVWSIITDNPSTLGQTQIGVYTVPIGHTAFILNKALFVEVSKPADMYFFARENCDDVVAPYTGVRKLVERELGLTGAFERTFVAPKGPFIGPCDMGFMGLVATGSSEASVEFEVLLIED